MLTALIVEDDCSQRNALINVLSEAFPEIQFVAAPDYLTAVKLMEKKTINLFLLDIDLQDLEYDGIALGHHIRTLEEYAHTPILYLTYLTDRIVEALNKIHCYHYICKPYTTNELIAAVMEVLKLPSCVPAYIRLKNNKGVYYKVKFDEVYFIETRRHQLVFHTPYGKYYVSNNSAKEMIKILPKAFIQCHKSYIINTLHISRYNRTKFEIKVDDLSDTIIPVGRVYKSMFEERVGIK